jgi:hypothetical protein
MCWGETEGAEALCLHVKALCPPFRYVPLFMLHRGDALVVHPSIEGRVVVLEYEVHRTILASGVHYDNRLIAVVTGKQRGT